MEIKKIYMIGNMVVSHDCIHNKRTTTHPFDCWKMLIVKHFWNLRKYFKKYFYHYPKVYIKILFKKIIEESLKSFYKFEYLNSLNWFKIYSHVLTRYYECCYINKFKIFNTNIMYHFKFDILNINYTKNYSICCEFIIIHNWIISSF